MSCEAFYPLLVRPSLSSSEAARLEPHLAACEACREAAALLDVLPREVPDRAVLAPGSRIDRYEIERLLGTGGMGCVYSAIHVSLGGRVAIKVLHRDLARSSELVNRFTQDAAFVTQLRGEHICRVTSFGESAGVPYMVLEYLDGEDLAAMLERERRIAVDTIADLLLQACAGLAEVHRRGVIHRDIKPSNLFVVRAPDGSALVKLLDFGVAKLHAPPSAHALTRTGARVGSIPYMAPEQLRSSKSVGIEADLWSLGATMFHLASGRLPFASATSPADTAIRIWTEEPLPLADVPAGFAAVVRRCLQKQPEARFRDVAELAFALAQHGGPNATALALRVERILRPR